MSGWKSLRSSSRGVRQLSINGLRTFMNFIKGALKGAKDSVVAAVVGLEDTIIAQAAKIKDVAMGAGNAIKAGVQKMAGDSTPTGKGNSCGKVPNGCPCKSTEQCADSCRVWLSCIASLVAHAAPFDDAITRATRIAREQARRHTGRPRRCSAHRRRRRCR